jgi:hypothetical protein
MSSKRINHEINRFNLSSKYCSKYQAILLDNNIDNNKIVCIHTINTLSSHSEVLCDFICHQDYPFKPFKIRSPLYGDYQKLLANIKVNKNYSITWLLSVFTQKNLFNKNICLCCDSITCYHNWNPSILFIDGVNEYLKNLQYYKYLSNKKNHIYLEKIFLQTFGNFPTEITDLILNFIINE